MTPGFSPVDPSVAAAGASLFAQESAPSPCVVPIPFENLEQPTCHCEHIAAIAMVVVGAILITLGSFLGGIGGLLLALGGGVLALGSFLKCIDFCEEPKTPLIYQLRNEAMQFVDETLQNAPYLESYLVNSLQRCEVPPKDENIPKIYALCHTFANKLEDELSNKSWSDPAVLVKADDLIRASYVLGLKTLEELPLQYEQSQQSLQYILQAGSTYYPKRTLFYLSVAYHLARTGAQTQDGILYFSSDSTPSPSHIDSFYKEDTFQSKWRAMYNDLAQRLHDLAPELFAEQEGEYFSWFQKDEGPDTYTPPTHQLPHWFARFEMR